MINGITTTIIFVFILSLLVFIHEFGHYIMARIIGVDVEEFGFGLPPRIFGKKIGRTIYSLNWLPVGGFVRLAGEDEVHDAHAKPTAKQMHLFWARTKLERTAILLAGVTMNFFLAILLTIFLLTHGVMEPSGRVTIVNISADSPAQTAHMQVGDLLKSITVINTDGSKVTKSLSTVKEVIQTANLHKGQVVTFIVQRQNETLEIALTPREYYPEGQGPIGVSLNDLKKHSYPLLEAVPKSVQINVDHVREMVVGIATLLNKIVHLQPVSEDVAGPIGIAQVTGQAVKFGFAAVIEFMSILSLNLAVLNVLPIPALDGGRVLFIVIEAITGKRVKPAWERNAHQVGMMVLFFLIFLVSINDILRIVRGG